MRKSGFIRIIAVAAAFTAALTTNAFAGGKAAFAGAPAGSKAIIRADLDGLSSMPQFAKVVATFKERRGGSIGQALLAGMIRADSSVDLTKESITNSPGSISVIELAMPELEFDDNAAVAMVLHGNFDGAKLIATLTKNGFTKAGEHSKLALFYNAKDKTALTMKDGQTMLISSTPESLGSALDASNGATPTLPGSKNPLAKLTGAASSSVLFAAVQITPEMHKKLDGMLKENEDQLKIIPFLPDVAAQLGSVNTVALSLAAGEAARFYLAANMATPDSAKKLADGLNGIIPIAAQMAKQQLGDDPDSAARLAEFAKTHFTVEGSQILTAFPVSEKVAESLLGKAMGPAGS